MALVGTKVLVQKTNASAILKRVVLRHREKGYLRFDMPADLLADGRADSISQALMRHVGIYRVLAYDRLGKLSIRFDPVALSEAQIALHLAAALAEPVAARPTPSGQAAANPLATIKEKVQSSPLMRWGEDKIRQGKQAIDAVGQFAHLKAKWAAPLPFDAKEWSIHFVNDLVAFYLIRMHWTRITKQWLPAPWAFRYQWLTVIYLTFILVRHRKTAMKKAAGK